MNVIQDMKNNEKEKDLLEILSEVFVKQSQIELLEFVQQWKIRINNGLSFPGLIAVNKLLNQLPNDQIDIIKAKFEHTVDYYQMHDTLAELFVASEYKKEKPVFIREKKTETPDLLLEKTKEYIEIKVINSSDYSHDFENFISRNSAPGMPVTGNAIPFSKTKARREILPKLIIKAKEKINKGREQIRNKNGLIYLLYRIDSVTNLFGRDDNGHCYDLSCFLSDELVNFINQYSIQTNTTIISKPYNLLHFSKIAN